jgi:hypothetical protein
MWDERKGISHEEVRGSGGLGRWEAEISFLRIRLGWDLEKGTSNSCKL